MEENGFTAEAVANGCCSKLYESEKNSRSEAATPATAAERETATSSVKAGEAPASTRSTAAAAVAEATQAAKEETAAGKAATRGGPAASETSTAAIPANGKAANSVLRSSIARYGSNSYYYAHAGLPGATEDTTKFAKVTEAPGVVTGGPPILLGRNAVGGEGNGAAAASDALLLSAADAAAAAVAGKRLSGFTLLQSYMWTDDGARVSVYVQLEKLPETPEEKKADPSFDAKGAAATFEEESAALVIHRKAKKYLLNLNKLYFPIKPSESRAIIKNDKVILRLVKEDENLTWFGLMKSK